jgi:hypothetical protein
VATVGEGRHPSADHTGRHADPEDSTASPLREFGRYLTENHREALLVVCGAGGATVGGFIQAFSPGSSPNARWLGLLIGVAGLLILVSYALRFYPRPLESPWWSQSRLRRAVRQIVLKAWALAIGAFFISGAVVWIWQRLR